MSKTRLGLSLRFEQCAVACFGSAACYIPVSSGLKAQNDANREGTVAAAVSQPWPALRGFVGLGQHDLRNSGADSTLIGKWRWLVC